MDSGIITNDYTEALDAEVNSVKSNEKVRTDYMLLQEAYAFGEYRKSVKQIRKNMQKTTIEYIADFLDISVSNCQSVIDLINNHPDWSDDQVAEEVCWDD